MPHAQLVLHCGSRHVTPEQLAQVPCPKPEGKWHQLPHATVLHYATQSLTDAGYPWPFSNGVSRPFQDWSTRASGGSSQP